VLTFVFNTLSLYVLGYIAKLQQFTKSPEAIQNQTSRKSFKKHAKVKGTQVLYCQNRKPAKPLISKDFLYNKEIVGTKPLFSTKQQTRKLPEVDEKHHLEYKKLSNQ